jgi:hypothetical protein
MTAPEGFEHRERKNGDVAVFHHGKLVKLLRGADAKALLAAMKKGDPQQAMADASGGPGSSKPGTGVTGGGRQLGGDGRSHAHGEFRRKSG